jgi:hypothetical protein
MWLVKTRARRKGTPVNDDRVFPLNLRLTYYNKGYFNLQVDYHHLIRDQDYISLILPDGQRIPASVNRGADGRDQVRVFGGVCLKNWFQDYCKLGEIVPIRFE